jgi:hypothetical protein
MTAISKSHEMHRSARGALDPFFSKAGMLNVKQRVLERVQRMGARLRMLQGTVEALRM